MAAIDNISAQFDGVSTTFPFTVAGVSTTLPPIREMDVNIGGRELYEGSDFTVVNTNLIFTSPPFELETCRPQKVER